MKKISVIIPCYNVEQWVDRCVRSLVNQTIGIDSLELIFVDDASTDGTVARLKRWERRFPDSILIIACEENGRQGAARNIGFSYASADYIGYVDADDWAEEDMYETLYRCAMEHDVDVVSCVAGRDTGDGKLLHVKDYSGRSGEKIVIRTEEERHQFLAGGLPGGVYTKLYKKSFLEDHHLVFPEKLAYEDNYFGVMLNYSVSSVYILNRPLYHYFYNLESTVTSRNNPHQLDRLTIEMMILEEMHRQGLDQSFRTEILNRFLKMYYINTLHLIFTRFDELPLEVLETMRTTVLETYPDWKESGHYESLSSMEKGFLLTLETDMTAAKWKHLKDNYLFLIKNRDKVR